MRRLLLGLALPLATIGPVPLAAAAQEGRIDLSIGLSGSAGRGALSLVSRGAAGPKIRLGTGFRITHYAGAAAQFTNRGTAGSIPASLSIDPSVFGVNLLVLGEIDLTRNLAFGANIDVVGFGFGSRQTSGGVVVKPAGWSLFRYGNRDRGSLNSELYLGIRPSRRLLFRAGLSHYVVGYRAVETSGSRYLRFDTVPFVSVAFPLKPRLRRR